MGTVSGSEIRRHLAPGTQTSNPSTNWASLAIGLARVKEVMPEELKCTLVILTGESDIQEYAGVDLSLPHGGRRSFLAGIPERGDICFIGWAARESTGTASAKTPVIVGWSPPAAWMGHEWIPYQPMEPGEGMDTVRDRSVASGAMERTRFKLRHLGEGNIMASSSQGSDMVLDDSVLLSNRRGNELRIRDEDQAIVVRSLQQYHAMAGVRTYGGMVHREARLLPSTMWSDGIYWDAPRQTGIGRAPIPQSSLGANIYPEGQLLPGLIFRRGRGDTVSAFEAARGASIPAILDPFDFLQWGSLVDTTGYRVDTTLPGGVSNTVYGGKPLYRVGLTSSGQVDNAVSSLLNGADGIPPGGLTEYRVEITHTADGTLPVTEQTDGFDADRLPTSNPSDGNPMGSGPQPFIEWVMGSVVGNDPFGYLGRPTYGVPLKAVVIAPTGELDPSVVTAVGSPLGDHAATLFRLTPPVGEGLSPSFTSFTKDGRFRAYIAGGPSSVEVATAGDFTLSVGGALNLNLQGGIHFNGQAGPGNIGASLGSASGAVVIRGGGAMDSGSAARGAVPGGMSESGAPSVLIDGTQNVTVRSEGVVSINGPTINVANAGTVNVGAQNTLTLSSGGRVSLTTQSLDQVISGRESTNYGGPHEGNPANGPSRSVTFSSTPATGGVGGVVDRYKMVFGDREEVWETQGNHSTTLTVGNLTYETRLGRWTAKAGTNTLENDSMAGLTETILAGDHSTTVLAGGISLTGQTDVSLTSIAGKATIRGTLGVNLNSPGTVAGAIMCGSDRDPLTGIPYSDLGLIPRLQTLGV